MQDFADVELATVTGYGLKAASRLSLCLCVSVVNCFLAFGPPAQAESLAPKLDIGKGGECVEAPAFMRANHMKLIVHQRDETVRKGIRGSKYSLANCVDCHASKVNHSVLGTNQNFCQGCHVYAAVKIDCFECHSSKPRAFSLNAGRPDEAIAASQVAAEAPVATKDHAATGEKQ